MSKGFPHDRIEEYLDGDLAPAQAAATRAHMESCDECREVVAESARLRRLAAAVAPVPIPADLAQRIRERLDRVDRAPGLLLRLPLLAGAAAAVLLVWLSLPPAELSPKGPEPVPVVSRAGAGLPVVLSDWLTQAENASSEDTPFLAAEARRLDLLARIRAARPGVGRGDREWLRAAEDLLVQFLNEPGADALAGEARVVAMWRR